MKKIHLIYSIALLCVTNSFASQTPSQTHTLSKGENKDAKEYYTQLPTLLKEENWSKVIILGEKALLAPLSSEDSFSIIDQLVSTYFRLGLFEKAEEKAQKLIELGSRLNEPFMIVDSLYKFSAALRGKAEKENDPEKKSFLFSQALQYAKNALTSCEELCPNDLSLRAKVLFNTGAAICDDPRGKISAGIPIYEEALSIFKNLSEEDYEQRTSIRLAKAHLLAGNLACCRGIVDKLHQKNLERRTSMHLTYLEAQLFLAEGRKIKAKDLAVEGLKEATDLHAEQDVKRFENFLNQLPL